MSRARRRTIERWQLLQRSGDYQCGPARRLAEQGRCIGGEPERLSRAWPSARYARNALAPRGVPISGRVHREQGGRMRARVLLVLGAVLAMMAVAVPAQAIKGGVPDAGAHPYVGQLLFYDPT